MIFVVLEKKRKAQNAIYF